MEQRLKDGGLFIIDKKMMDRWKSKYPKVNIETAINELDFSKCSLKGALKLINETLKEKSNE